MFKTEEQAPRSDYMDLLKYFLVFEKRHAALTLAEIWHVIRVYLF